MIESITNLSVLFDLITALMTKASVLIGAASVLAATLKKPESKGLLADLHNLINATAFNFGHAKNKE